jgi:hypothetical protein
MAMITSKKPALFGADPEVFLKNAEGKYISAINKFPGTKERPQPVPSLGKGFGQQVDNVLLEYNVPPVTKVGKWVEQHTNMLEHLRKQAKEKGLLIEIVAAAEMPEDELLDPMSRVFGCEPDYNAWTLEVNQPPRCDNPNLRSAGGHIHIGVENWSQLQKINLVRYMDLTLGAWSVIADPDTKRRELYGRPGAMRFKPYGVEYRTVSNFWLQSPEYLKKAFNLAYRAVGYGPNGKFAGMRQNVESMFRNGDKLRAEEFLSEFGG